MASSNSRTRPIALSQLQLLAEPLGGISSKMKTTTAITIIGILICSSFNFIDSTFDKFYNKLKHIELPVDINCESDIAIVPFNSFDEQEQIRYLNYYGVIGRINFEDGLRAVVYNFAADNQVPVLVTYDKYGLEVDTLNLFDMPCVEDLNLKYYSTFKIESTGNIQMRKYEIWTKWNEEYTVKTSMDTIKSEKKYFVKDDGKIKQNE